jgi:hypothetical protein
MLTRHGLVALFLLVWAICPAKAKLLHVPGDYALIQAAINAAADGDTVLVAPGTYFENLNLRGKKVLLASYYLLDSDPGNILSTIIDGSSPTHPDTASCIVFASGEDSTTILEGFTLTGGTGTVWLDRHIGGLYREGGAILTEASSPTIAHNRIVHNTAVNTIGVTSAGGGGIRCDGGNPRIVNNLIAWNRGRYGAGVVLNFTGAIIKNNIIASNAGGEDFGGSGIWAYSNGPSSKTVENNTIVNNESAADGGGVLVWSTSIVLRNNIIWGNTAQTAPEIRLRQGGSVTVTYSDVQGGWSGTGNKNEAPSFADTSFYLQVTSPCVDAGDTNRVYNDPPDPASSFSAAWPSLGSVRNDMGAYGGPGRSLIFTFPTSVERLADGGHQKEFLLLQNYPNPCNPSTTIAFSLNRPSTVSITLCDILGRELKTLAEGHFDIGTHAVHVAAESLPSGVYFYRLTTDGFSDTKRMLLIR